MTPDPNSPAAGSAPDSPGFAPAQSYEHLALQAAGVGTWLWHISAGELVWGDLTYRLFGVERESFEPSPKTVRELIHPDDRERLDQQVSRCFGQACDFNVEYRVTWPKDGSVHHLRTRGRIYRSQDGTDVRMTGACWDITERKRLEEDLARERYLLRTLMEHLPDTIYFKDARSRFILVSDQTMRGFGVENLAEVVGKTDFDFFTEEHARQAFADEQRIVQTGEGLRGYEEKETWPDGHETWVSTTKLPLRDEVGRIIGTFGLSRDITEHRRAEEQLARYAEELRHRNRDLEEDLEMARELQGALMPRQYPSFDGFRSHGSALRFSHVFNPSAMVSGDFFDIIKVSDTAAGIFICDVMGHGVRAALVAAIVRALVSEAHGSAGRPGEFLERLNRKLFGILSQTEIPMFASASYVVADIEKGEIAFANAGHPEPLCIHHGSPAAMSLSLQKSARGPVLGMFEAPNYGASSRRLSVRDVVLQFTDGLYEVEGAGGELYDEKCLIQAVNRRTNLRADELCHEVLAEIQQFSANKQFSDDVCLVAVEVERLGAA
ncbi:MAG TPA: SpoIIE family protein phosphatase [Chthoniobacteraceae bacterium]